MSTAQMVQTEAPTEEKNSVQNTLSMAIREGAKLHPKCQSRYLDMSFGIRTCAIGGAVEYLFGLATLCYLNEKRSKNPNIFLDVLSRVFPDIHRSLIVMIIQRNDAGISREEIADWLESKGH